MSAATVASAVVMETGLAEPVGPATAGTAMAVGGPDVVTLVICRAFEGNEGRDARPSVQIGGSLSRRLSRQGLTGSW